MDSENKWCFAWYEDPESAADSATRAALVRKAKWKPGDEITISFLEGTDALRQRVQNAAMGWVAPALARLKFSFRKNTNDTHIRISFSHPGSWSVIGTTCKQVTKKQPTMNYGWLTETSDEAEVQRVVLHEFGHALGLIHEHQHPTGGIKWNKDAVYHDLSGPPNNWSKTDIDHNMFEAYSKNETNFSSFDPKSIMMYPIPKSWTLNGFSTVLNTQLSDTDKKFIHEQYK